MMHFEMEVGVHHTGDPSPRPSSCEKQRRAEYRLIWNDEVMIPKKDKRTRDVQRLREKVTNQINGAGKQDLGKTPEQDNQSRKTKDTKNTKTNHC